MRQRVDAAAEEVDELLALLGDHDVEPETVLDVACGIGRHAVPLAERGLDVHGVDLSPEYVTTSRDRAAKADVADTATFEVGDMRELDTVGGEYDVVTNLWTAFGYYDDATNEAVAEGFRKRVAAGGALVMELANKEAMMANYHDSAAGLEDGLLHAERREYDPERGRIETTLTLLREQDDAYESVGEVTWDLRVYGPAEVRRLLDRAGFSTVQLYGGFAGSPLERESNRLVVVAKP